MRLLEPITASPIPTDEERRVARLLWWIGGGSLVASLFSALSSTALSAEPALALGFTLPFPLVYLSILALVYVGRPRLAGHWLMLTHVLLFNTLIAWFGGYDTALTAFVPTLPVTAGLVLGARAALGWGGVTALLLTLVTWAQATGRLPEVPPHSPWDSFSVLLSGLGYAGALTWAGTRALTDAAESARNLLSASEEDRRATERAQHQLSSVLDAMADPLLVFGADGAIQLANPAARRMLGDEPPLVGRRADSLGVTGATVDLNRPAARRQRREVNLRTADGRLLDALVLDAPVLLGSGETGRVWSIADVSTLKQAERIQREAAAAAEEANRAKSQFLANMSHELRTPLNAIIGYAEMLEEDLADVQATAVDDLRRIQGSGRHLLQLINDVLDLSKIEAGRMEVVVEAVAPRQIVEEAIALVTPLAERNGNVVGLDFADDVGLIRTDSSRLRQILINLLSNAAKFTRDGAVTLSVTRGRGGLRFTVRDTGIGIDPSRLDALFEPFTQADASTSRQYGGTGLGLALCKRFAEMLGGHIEARSRLGEGSAFTLWLPAADQTPTPTTQRGREHVADRPLVLVVDDDPVACELLSRMIDAAGFDTQTVHDGASAIEIAARRLPAAITLDVMMPGMDGWTLLARLKAHPDTRHIPVVMVTIVDEKGTARALGAATLLPKPIDRERLTAALRRLIRRTGTLLVVDDDAEVRTLLTRRLEAEGWRVRTAGTGAEALTALRDEVAPDGVILDLMMPGIDGFGVAAEMRADPRLARIPVIVLSALDLSPSERALRLPGLQHFVSKGEADFTEVLDELQRAVAPRATPDSWLEGGLGSRSSDTSHG